MPVAIQPSLSPTQRRRLHHHRVRATTGPESPAPACNARMGAIPSDPKECRLRAQECADRAKRADTEKARQTFLRLQRSYNRLAVELEDAEATFAALKPK